MGWAQCSVCTGIDQDLPTGSSIALRLQGRPSWPFRVCERVATLLHTELVQRMSLPVYLALRRATHASTLLSDTQPRQGFRMRTDVSFKQPAVRRGHVHCATGAIHMSLTDDGRATCPPHPRILTRIHTEVVRDLLTDGGAPLKVVDDPDRGGNVAEGLLELGVKGERHLEEMLKAVEARRHVSG